MPDRTVRVINKNGRESIRVALAEYKNARYVDIRLFATSPAATLTPTTKGVTVRPDLLRPTIEALLEAERLLIADGTLKADPT